MIILVPWIYFEFMKLPILPIIDKRRTKNLFVHSLFPKEKNRCKSEKNLEQRHISFSDHELWIKFSFIDIVFEIKKHKILQEGSSTGNFGVLKIFLSLISDVFSTTEDAARGFCSWFLLDSLILRVTTWNKIVTEIHLEWFQKHLSRSEFIRNT